MAGMKKREVPKNKINPVKLREARELRQLTLKEVSRQTKISAQMISLYETNNASINFDNMLKLYSIYGLPMAFYYKNSQINHVRTQFYFRSFHSSTLQARKQAKLKATLVIEHIIDEVLPHVHIPDVDPLCARLRSSAAIESRKSKDNELDVEVMAKIIRREWGLGLEPINNLVRLLEQKGFIIISMDIDKRLDAFSFWDNQRPYIVVSTKTTAVRRRMSIAHELCHLLFHDAEEVEHELKQLEIEAAKFAGCFLMPEESFSVAANDTSLKSLLLLKPIWKVSVQAMVMRCKEIGKISDGRYLYLEKEISRQHWRKSEPYDDMILIEEPVILKQVLNLLVDKKIYSKENLLNKIALDSDSIIEACRLDSDFFDLNKGNEIITLSQT